MEPVTLVFLAGAIYQAVLLVVFLRLGVRKMPFAAFLWLVVVGVAVVAFLATRFGPR